MSYQLTIEPIGQVVEVEEGQTILDAALRAGIYLPHACGHGLCGTCKVQVLEGAVRHLGPVSCAHVSDLERDQGYTLACRVAPLEAVRIAVAQRLHKPFFLRAASTAPTTHDTPTSN